MECGKPVRWETRVKLSFRRNERALTRRVTAHALWHADPQLGAVGTAALPVPWNQGDSKGGETHRDT